MNERALLWELAMLELANVFLEQRTNDLSWKTLPVVIVGSVGEDIIAEKNRLTIDFAI